MASSLYRLAGGSSGHPLSSPALYLLSAALATACLAGAAAWAVGKDRWNELRQFIRPAESKFVVLGVIFPIAIEFVPNLAGYSLDRMNWAASQLNSAAPPLFGWYFHIPRGYHFWYLLGAAWEEVIWRGYLQPRFVRRYGLIRGIFLLGLVWAAVHFTGDFRGSMRDSEVLIKLASRIAQCVAMSYVLGWLTLRSGSIWPAVLAHGFANIWIYSAPDSLGVLFRPILVVCWGLLGFVLFRFWPPSTVPEATDQLPEVGIEPSLSR